MAPANTFIADVHKPVLADRPDLYDPLDFDSVRGRIMTGAKEALSRRFPLTNDRYTLTLDDVDYDDADTPFSKKEQKQAILDGRSLEKKLKGSWTLRDNATGLPVSKSRRQTVLNVPWLTDRGTFIRAGNEITLTSQMRLMPGVYTRQKANGEMEAHVNVKPGTGSGFKVNMDPRTGVFFMEHQTRRTQLYPVLRAMGVKDADLNAYWGPELVKANYNALKNEHYMDPESKEFQLAGSLAKMELDPVSTHKTLGQPFKTVTPQALALTARRLSNIASGKEKEDVRDSLQFQRFYDSADLISERVLKDAGGVGRKLLWKATNTGTVEGFPSGALNPYMQSLFVLSGLAQLPDSVNPADIYQKNMLVTRLGEGGIGDDRAAPFSARLVHNTYKGFIDPAYSPEKIRAGLNSMLVHGVRKSPNGLLYVKMRNARTGADEWVHSIDSSRSKVHIPGDEADDERYVAVTEGEEIRYVPRDKVDFQIQNGDALFNLTSNLTPFKACVKPGRLLMGTRMASQALSLESREAPLVSTTDPVTGRSVSDVMGDHLGNLRSKKGGTVKSVDGGLVTIVNPDGATEKVELYDNFPFNKGSYIRSFAVVKPGDRLEPNGLVAHSNFTDKDGRSALGTNLRIGYLAWKGLPYKDAVVISESAAKKLSSEHMVGVDVEKSKAMELGKDNFMRLFPGAYSKEQMDKIGPNGLAVPGSVVNRGDPVIVAYETTEPSKATFGRRLTVKRVQEWEHDHPGVVTDVMDGKQGASAYVRSLLPAQEADKTAGCHGNKGVISRILPDNQMPHGEDGKPLDMLMAPVGIISRVNSSQLLEAALGKVARKTGKPYSIPGFMKGEDAVNFVQGELRKHGLSDTETLTDPETGRKIPGVFTGDAYMYKLHHTSEKKWSARSTGGYTSEELPATGGREGAKRLGNLILGALASHSANEVIKDAKLIRGQKNQDFWRDFKMGKTPAMPGTPLIYDKMLAHMRGAGININEDRNRLNIFALTNADVNAMRTPEVRTADTFDAKTFLPINGGLFGADIFGKDGTQWAHIALPHPVPNPVMEDGMRAILGLTEKRFEGVLSGKEDIPGVGGGPLALKRALAKVDVAAELQGALEAVKTAPASARDRLIKKIRYLEALKTHSVRPDDFMLDKIPVIPPRFRPITQAGGMFMASDSNYFYKDLLDKVGDFKAAQKELPASELGDLQLGIYKSFKSLTGLSDPDSVKMQEKNVGGLLKWLFGKGPPKFGAFQRSVLGGSMDVVGRAVLTPNPALKIDEAGLPENQAWDLYADFVVRKMVRNGWKVPDAVKAVSDRTKAARPYLEQVAQERPVIVTRAPALHKYSVMAFTPRLVKGHSLQLPPPVLEPFNADHDGDTLSYYVPVSDKAVQEAREKMMPSRNLLSARWFKAHYIPEEDYIMGAWLASRREGNKPVGGFKTPEEAIAAYKAGRIKATDPVMIG